jgi:hypothetical protein
MAEKLQLPQDGISGYKKGNTMKNPKKRVLLTGITLLAFLWGGCGGGSSSGTGGTGESGGGGATGGTIILDWDAPTTNADGTALTDLGGYRIRYGTTPGVYDHSIDVGNVTTYTLIGLTKGQMYYAVATAYDISGNESGYSNEFQGAAK